MGGCIALSTSFWTCRSDGFCKEQFGDIYALIIPFIVSRVAPAFPPCSITAIHISLTFGAMI